MSKNLIIIYLLKFILIYDIFKFDGHCLKLPTAPYNVKLFCQNGRAETIRSMNPSLCPTSSTSCGYFNFAIPEKRFNRNTTEVYECVDSSILLSAEEDYDDRQTNPYYQICNHRPQCRVLTVSDLNKQFLNYLVRAHGLRLDSFRTQDFLFCCSLSHSNLARLIKSKASELPFSSSVLPVKCNKLQCAIGAIGCLFHEKTSTNFPLNPQYTDIIGQETTSHEYFDVKPVELTWNDEDFIIDGGGISDQQNYQEMAASNTLEINKIDHLVEEFGLYDENNNSNSDESDYNDGYKCVQMHLNDEVYRYCMMIYAQKSSNRCIEFDGHRICCCFVNPFESTCDPKMPSFEPMPSTSTLPSIATSTMSIYPKIKVTATSSVKSSSKFRRPKITPTSSSTTTTTTTTTLAPPPITVTQRTKCRTVLMTESRQLGRYKTKPRTRKRIICDDIRPSTTTPSSSGTLSIKVSMSFIILIIRLLFLSFVNFY